MNYKKMIVSLFAGTLAAVQCFAADANLLKNTNFDVTTKNGKNVVAGWWARTGNVADMVVDGSVQGKKAIKMPLAPNRSKIANFANNISCGTLCEKGGTYVVSASIMPSRKFTTMQIMTFYKDSATQKSVYQAVSLKPEQYPASGKWTRIAGEIKVPENTLMGYAIEIRDRDSGEGYLLIEDPNFTLREE